MFAVSFIANKVTDRERYIAPRRLEMNFARTGGWAFISGFVAVLPGVRWVGGGATSGSAATKTLASHSLVFSVCANAESSSQVEHECGL